MNLKKLCKFRTIKKASEEEKNSLMMKMVTSYSIFLLVIFIMAVFLYTISIENIRSRQESQSRSLLSGSVQLFDKDLNIMEVFCRQMLQDKNFIRLAASPNEAVSNFYIKGSSTKKTLAANVYPDSLLPIDEYYIYMQNSKYIVSPNYFSKMQMYYTSKNSHNEDMYEDWVLKHEDEAYYNTFIPLSPYRHASGNSTYMYLLDMSEMSYRSLPAVASFVIDQNKLLSRFAGIDFAGGGTVVAVSPNGQQQFCLYDFSKNAPSAYKIEELLSLPYDNAIAPYNNGVEKLVVTAVTSSLNNWTYYLMQPQSFFTLDTQKYSIFFVVSIVLAFALGGYLVFFFSKRNVRPIIRLGQELQVAVEAQNQLQEVVDKQKPIIQNSYVRQLMRGTISSEDEASYMKSYLELAGEHLSYNVLYVVIYNNAVDMQEGLPDSFSSSEELNAVMTNALRQYVGAPLYCYIPSERTYALLLSCNASYEDSFIMRVQDAVIKLHDYLLDTYSIWMFASIGKNTDSLTNVWESYQQAVEAVSYTSKNYIFFPYEFIKKDSNVFYYPPELSAKLIHFITTGNTAQMLELFSLIHQENIEERSLPINLLKFLLSDIRNTLLRARFALPSSTPKEAAVKLDALFNEHLSFKLCEDIALTLCKLFTVESSDNNLAATIEKYIQNNYRDPSLCLNKISDEFQISESYFSHMFKEKTGVNFSVYLENIRMSEAAKLVRETDTNLSELYITVGYNNPNSFRRAFKKIFGVVPSSMRESAQK